MNINCCCHMSGIWFVYTIYMIHSHTYVIYHTYSTCQMTSNVIIISSANRVTIILIFQLLFLVKPLHYFSLFNYYPIIILHYPTIIFTIILLLFLLLFYFWLLFFKYFYYCFISLQIQYIIFNYFNHFTLQVLMLWEPAGTNTGPVNQILANYCIGRPSVALCA